MNRAVPNATDPARVPAPSDTLAFHRALPGYQATPLVRAKELAGGRPSLLQDVMRGRRTEVQYLNGYVSEQGRQVGVATPFNDKVVELITSVPPGTLKPDPKNLDPLVAMLPR